MATVIKVGQQDPKLLKRLETLDVTDHVTEAHAIVDSAKRRGAEIVRSARRDAEKLRADAGEKGYEEGFRRGYEGGKRAGHDEAFEQAAARYASDQAQLATALDAMLAQFDELKRDLFIQARDDVLRFAVRVAEKVTRLAGAFHGEAAANNLESALRLVESRTDLVARVHPLDCETAGRFAADFVARVGPDAHLKVLPDDSIAPGGCLLETPNSQVDATIDTQIDQVAQLLVIGEGMQ